ncbi:myeloperoxidase-like [Mizuhopecten yessoensis]|uniref:myeloperoxidase-like n=1 Tax=Mizuhopecten yessoensis TaxID=6573 RepID=UPI000B45E76B|nr:myeloperoxidase-like [Mizuhopecten yessoensis]
MDYRLLILASFLLAVDVKGHTLFMLSSDPGQIRQKVQTIYHTHKQEMTRLPVKSLTTRPSAIRPNFHEQFVLPSREMMVRKQTRLAGLSLGTIKQICTSTGSTVYELLEKPGWQEALRTEFGHDCQDLSANLTCNALSRYRTIDGSCNNPFQPTWGMAGTQQTRYLRPVYNDGINSPRLVGRDGIPLPSARMISNIVHSSKGFVRQDCHLSAMVMQWGQFLDHDIVGTPVLKKDNGSSYECCEADSSFEGCFPVDIPPNDDHFEGKCMNMVRSAPAVGPDCAIGAREQMNKVTSYIDASAVYGSSREEEAFLRAYNRGMLKEGDNRLLPPSGRDNCIQRTPADVCMTAGDDRPNVVPSLGSIHTLFMREHNRIAAMLGVLNRFWDDERIFQETRQIMSALLQHITYYEYLPLILGKRIMEYYKILPTTEYKANIYNTSINAGIANVFAVAAFRFGHSQIPSIQTFLGPRESYRHDFRIETTYHRPFFAQFKNGQGTEDVLRWLVKDSQPETNRVFVRGVRDQLFLRNNVSLDLAAINIQRGRDHGVPPYNAWRKWCGLAPARHFGVEPDGLIHHTIASARLLQRAYRDPDDIDVFPGAISERHLKGASVGPTFACILGYQFQELKQGDRFWYERAHPITGFTERQLRSIRRMRLSKILCENFNITPLQKNVFLLPNSKVKSSHLVPCHSLPDLDIRAWQDYRYGDSPSDGK